MDCLQCVKLGRARPVARLEMPLRASESLIGIARQAVVRDLFGPEHQRVEPDIEVFMAVAAQDVLDLAGDRDRHAVAGRIEVGDIKDAGLAPVFEDAVDQHVAMGVR